MDIQNKYFEELFLFLQRAFQETDLKRTIFKLLWTKKMLFENQKTYSVNHYNIYITKI